MALLTQSDAERIERAIAEVEGKSAAELVVAVVPKSAAYSGVRALVAACWGLAAAAAFIELVPHRPAIFALVAELVVGVAAWFASGAPPLLRWLVPRALAERAVESRAFELFARRGIHQTRDATGLLIVLSELERRVVLLGDRGIHARVGTEGWNKHVEHIIGRIRERRAADGVIEVLHELQGSLIEHVPIRPDDENELPNAVVRQN
jgi:putative membrane protein